VVASEGRRVDEALRSVGERALRWSASRRGFLQAGAGVAASAFLAACGVSQSTGGTKRKKVAFILPSYTQARWQNADQKYFQQEAAKHNLDVLIQVSNDDEVLQASQVDNVLTQQIDVLVLTAVNVDTAKAMVRKAKNANVPTIAYNYIISDVPLAAVVSRDAKQVGHDLASAVVSAAPKGNYVLVFGDQGTSVAQDKGSGCLSVIQPLVNSGDIKIVSQQWNRAWAPDLAQKQVENALTANRNNIQAVLPMNDGMAYGAIQALKGQGLGGKVPVTGEDCEVQALKLINEGSMLASSFTPFNQMGIAAAKAAAAVANGQKVTTDKTINNGQGDVPWVQIAAFNVTKSNLSKFLDDYPWWATRAQVGI
jgi:D-xylose transport system substrate-binding protein